MLDSLFIPAEDRQSKRLMIMLHGLGDSYEGYLWWPGAMHLPWLNYLLVNAPDEYFGGYSWFDFPDNPEPGVRRSYRLLAELLEHQREKGFSPEQTIIGGFSQGGLMSIEVAARYPHKLAGAISVSGAVCTPEKLVKELSPVARQQKILAIHGTYDSLIPCDYVRKQINLLKQAGLNIKWVELPKDHTIAGEAELSIIREFIRECFGDNK